VLPGISIILPARNEQDNLPLVVQRSLGALADAGGNGEVIVVDDGSADGTARVARRLVAEHPDAVSLISHARNLGYGAALRTGFDRAAGDLVFCTDADNQFDPSDVKYFLPMMDEYDMVIGFRVNRCEGVLRSIASWFYNRLVGVLFRTRARDINCAFKVMRRELLQDICLECDNFFIDTELVARARKANFRIAQTGVRHYPRMAGETTVELSDLPRTLREVTRMWQRIHFPTRGQAREYRELVCAHKARQHTPGAARRAAAPAEAAQP
jgi:dolichol-phosphate mannosyltransferase